MKRILVLIFCVLLVFSLSGCFATEEIISYFLPKEITDEEISLQQQEFINIGYSNSYDEDEIQFVLSVDELKAWENPYEKYSSYILYNSLSDENEKLVYHALEYALVNSYQYTFIDYRIDVNRERIREIAELLSLDTPLLEQNLVCNVFYQVAFYNYEYSEERTVEVLHRSNTISVRNFSHLLWMQKMLAVDIAETIIDDLDPEASEIEKAEEIYRFIAENVTYIPYENEYGHYQGALKPFLYDALVLKETHCDGFTNALALLYAMAGFEQVEKHNVTTMGHTWNFVKIDGSWYNIEGTAGSYIPEGETTMGSGLMFAFPDFMNEDYADLKELYEASESSYYMNPDGFTESCDSDDFFDIILDGFSKHNDEWALVIIDIYNEDSALRELDNLVYTYYESMKYYKLDIAEGKTALLYLRGDLIE